MDKYLKMAGAFDLPVKTRHVHDENGYGFKLMLLHSVEAECAANAINSHDELVQMNLDLLAALEIARECLNHPGGTSGSLWIEANEKAIAAITKAKGGAA